MSTTRTYHDTYDSKRFTVLRWRTVPGWIAPRISFGGSRRFVDSTQSNEFVHCLCPRTHSHPILKERKKETSTSTSIFLFTTTLYFIHHLHLFPYSYASSPPYIKMHVHVFMYGSYRNLPIHVRITILLRICFLFKCTCISLCKRMYTCIFIRIYFPNHWQTYLTTHMHRFSQFHMHLFAYSYAVMPQFP